MTRSAYEQHLVPETKVLAIASHVVSGYVGNKIAVLVLQSLGCDVAALNTVQFSNHTGYGQWTGNRATAEDILSLYQGLKNSYLADFDMMLSGYTPGAAGVEAVGQIARELAENAAPGRFFWVLDPVMGDNGSLYVAEDVVPAYRNLLRSADLILPNQFEAELLSETKITSLPTVTRAIQTLHERYGVPHVVITSLSLPHPNHAPSTLSVVGSTMTSDRRARPFKIVFPAIDAYFSGTGDMFAALMVVRMREAICAAAAAEAEAETFATQESGMEDKVTNLDIRLPPPSSSSSSPISETRSWRSPDGVDALDLPLARAAEKVLGSMHEVLTRTRDAMVAELEAKNKADGDGVVINGDGHLETDESATAAAAEKKNRTMHLLRSKAAELRLVRNLSCLREPGTEFRAQVM